MTVGDNAAPYSTPGYAAPSYPVPPQSPYLNQEFTSNAGDIPMGHGSVLFSADWKRSKFAYLVFLLCFLMFIGFGIWMFVLYEFFVGSLFFILPIFWIVMIFMTLPTKVEVSEGFVLIHKRLSLCTRPIPLATIGSVVRIPYCGGEVVTLYRAFGIMRRNRIVLRVAQHEVEPLYNAIASQLNTNNIVTVIV